MGGVSDHVAPPGSPRLTMGNKAGLLREFLDSEAGKALGKALGESLVEPLTAMLAMQGDKVELEKVTAKPNVPIPVSKEDET